MIQFYILMFLDALLLQPFRVVLGFVMRFLWHPPKTDIYTGIDIKTIEELKVIAETRRPKLSGEYYSGGDAAKFLGMMYHIGILQESVFLKLFTEDGQVRRNLKTPYTEDEETFSTDMAAGLMLGITGLPRGYEQVCSMFERTTFKGCPMLFSSYLRGKELFGRGHIYRPWWIHGSEDVLTGLAWLRLAYYYTEERRYNVASWFWFILHLPTILLACPDAQIWVGRVYGTSWHNTHSKAMVFFVGALTGGWMSWVFRRALRYVCERYEESNVDILIMRYIVSGGNYNSLILRLLTNVVDKGYFPCNKNTKYLSLFWPPSFVVNAGTIQDVTCRGNDYVWERSPIKGNECSEQYREVRCLDLIFPVYMYERACKILDY